MKTESEINLFYHRRLQCSTHTHSVTSRIRITRRTEECKEIISIAFRTIALSSLASEWRNNALWWWWWRWRRWWYYWIEYFCSAQRPHTRIWHTHTPHTQNACKATFMHRINFKHHQSRLACPIRSHVGKFSTIFSFIYWCVAINCKKRKKRLRSGRRRALIHNRLNRCVKLFPNCRCDCCCCCATTAYHHRMSIKIISSIAVIHL